MEAEEFENGQESSSNFDLEHVRPFLERVSPLIESGFGLTEIEQVCQVVEAMEVDDEKELEFPIRYAGGDSHLRVGIFMDDEDAVDLYFFSKPELAIQIDDEMEKFFNQLEL